MAQFFTNQNNRFIVLTAKEAVDMIGLLAAQLAGVALSGNHAGGCPEIRVTDEEYHTYRITFSVAPRDFRSDCL